MKIQKLLLRDITDRIIFLIIVDDNNSECNIQGDTEELNIQIKNETLNISPNDSTPNETSMTNSKFIAETIGKDTGISIILSKNIPVYSEGCEVILVTQAQVIQEKNNKSLQLFIVITVLLLAIFCCYTILKYY